MERVLFSEKQYFRKLWFWIILIVAAAVSIIPFVIGIYTQEVLGKPWGNNPGSTGLLFFVLIFNIILMGGLIFLFLKMHLSTEVRTNGFWFKYPPLSPKWKCFKQEEIEKFEIRIYRPAKEFGGWGIKGSRINKAYNVSGNVGLQLYLTDGKKVLFGTQQKLLLERAMERMIKSERME